MVNFEAYRNLEIFLVPFRPQSDKNSTSTLHRVCPCRAISRYIEAKWFSADLIIFVCYDEARKGHAASKMVIARGVQHCII